MAESRLTAYQVMEAQAKTVVMEVGFDDDRKRWIRLLLPLAGPVDAAGMQDMSRPTLLIASLDRLDTAGYTWDRLAIDPRVVRLRETGAGPIERGLVDSIVRSGFCPRCL